jgi:hypothetical protein
MAETKEVIAEAVAETTYRFEEIDDMTVNITVIDSNGSGPFALTLNGVNWGMFDDVMGLQEEVKANPRAIPAFFDQYIEGGARAVPIRRTLPLFEAISQYLNQVMTTQKN